MHINQIVILSDSLSLPRDLPEYVDLSFTYPFLLNEKYGGVINCGYGAATSEDILWQVNYFKNAKKADLFILHFGIVDCTPRVLTRYESWAIRKLKIRLSSRVVGFLRKCRVVRKVEPKIFKENCISIKKILDNKIMLVVPIAPAGTEFERSVPGVRDSIIKYNAILRDQFGDAYLHVDLNSEEDIMGDYHHLTANGHKKIFKAIDGVLNSTLSSV